MTALFQKKTESERARDTEKQGVRQGICKSNSILAVMNSVSGHPRSGEEIIASNRLQTAKWTESEVVRSVKGANNEYQIGRDQ